MANCKDCLHYCLCEYVSITGKTCKDFKDKYDWEKVTRCKDCKHWKDVVSGCTDHVKCCEIGFYMVCENGYCVYGEKEA